MIELLLRTWSNTNRRLRTSPRHPFQLKGAQNPRLPVNLLAYITKELGNWLNLLPVSALGQRMDDDAIRMVAGTFLRRATHAITTESRWTTHDLVARVMKGDAINKQQ